MKFSSMKKLWIQWESVGKFYSPDGTQTGGSKPRAPMVRSPGGMQGLLRLGQSSARIRSHRRWQQIRDEAVTGYLPAYAVPEFLLSAEGGLLSDSDPWRMPSLLRL